MLTKYCPDPHHLWTSWDPMGLASGQGSTELVVGRHRRWLADLHSQTPGVFVYGSMLSRCSSGTEVVQHGSGRASPLRYGSNRSLAQHLCASSWNTCSCNTGQSAQRQSLHSSGTVPAHVKCMFSAALVAHNFRPTTSTTLPSISTVQSLCSIGAAPVEYNASASTVQSRVPAQVQIKLSERHSAGAVRVQCSASAIPWQF